MRLDELVAGLERGPSSWFELDQARIDAFAEVTGDRQWIHVDPERARRGPFGGPVAHGLLTLSLVPAALFELLPVDALVLNYGLDRVRFPAPVPAGSRLRASLRLAAVEQIAEGLRVAAELTFRREGLEKPVCVAEQLLWYLG